MQKYEFEADMEEFFANGGLPHSEYDMYLEDPISFSMDGISNDIPGHSPMAIPVPGVS